MKEQKKGPIKLSLKKIKIAKITNPHLIIGGADTTTDTNNATNTTDISNNENCTTITLPTQFGCISQVSC